MARARVRARAHTRCVKQGRDLLAEELRPRADARGSRTGADPTGSSGGSTALRVRVHVRVRMFGRVHVHVRVRVHVHVRVRMNVCLHILCRMSICIRA